MKKRGLTIILIFIVILLGVYFALKSNEHKVNKENSITETKKNSINISFVGDVLIHQDMLDAAKSNVHGEYDFSDCFKFIKDKIKECDFAVANLETTLSGSEKIYSGYPRFNTPESILDSLKHSGFDMVSLANNHINDRGKYGILRTVEAVKNSGLNYMGARGNEEEQNYIVKDIKGIKVGFVNYVFETARMNGLKSINSIPLDKSVETLVNTFNINRLDEDYTKMKQAVDSMKSDGAEFIVFSMHWGEEYYSQPNEVQKKMAQKIADLGANLIIGGHPHVLQPIDVITTEDNREVPVIYSLGNFVSHQRYELLSQYAHIGEKAWRTEESIIANVELKKDSSTDKVEISQLSYTPIWVNRNVEDNLYYHEVVPIKEAINNPNEYNIKHSSFVERMQKSYDFILSNMKSMTQNKIVKHPIQ